LALLILFERVLSDIRNPAITGENIKITGFGTFFVRSKGERVGRNPRTGVEVPIEKRRLMLFKPSEVLTAHTNGEAPAVANRAGINVVYLFRSPEVLL
jgi:integration host factor subunit alpha